MSRLFSKVAPAVWGSKRFTALPSSDAKLLYLFFLTCEHNNSAGAYRIRQGYALADLGWTAKLYADCIAKLIEAELIAYDEATEEVYVLRWFKHNPAANQKHALGCRRIILELDSQAIAELAMAEFEEVERSRNPLDGAAPNVNNVTTSLRDRLAAGVYGKTG